MSERLIKLAERRATLIARADNQRDALAIAVEPWRKPLALADRGLAIANYLRQQPALLAGGAALTMLLRPRRILKWTQRGWLAWRFITSIKRKLYGG